MVAINERRSRLATLGFPCAGRRFGQTHRRFARRLGDIHSANRRRTLDITSVDASAANNTAPFSVTDNSVDDSYTFSWSGSFDFPRSNGNSLQLFWAVNNLFDEDPPIATGRNFYPTNPVFSDTIGRRYRAGVRVEF